MGEKEEEGGMRDIWRRKGRERERVRRDGGREGGGCDGRVEKE